MDNDEQRRCGVCGGPLEGPCQTPSGRHWVSADETPVPEVVRVALTDPALRTLEEQSLLEAHTAKGNPS